MQKVPNDSKGNTVNDSNSFTNCQNEVQLCESIIENIVKERLWQ